MKRILIDADALVALAKEDDSNHKKAVALSSKIKKSTIYISPFTIPEAVTVISYHVGQSEARRFLEKVRKLKIISLTLDREVIDLSDRIFLEQKTKRISWFDCCNVALIKKYQIDGIFSFDKFYKKQAIKVLL